MSVEALIAVASGLTIVAILLRRPEWWRELLGALRAAPVELALVVVAIGAAIALLAGESLNVGIVLAGLVVATLLAGRNAVEDYVLGVFVRVSGNIRIGDTVVVDDHEGGVHDGYRSKGSCRVIAHAGRRGARAASGCGRAPRARATTGTGCTRRWWRARRRGSSPTTRCATTRSRCFPRRRFLRSGRNDTK